MNELTLIKYLLNKELYERYHEYLSKDYLRHNFPEVYKMYLVLSKLHEQDVQIQGLDDLKALFFAAYPALKKGEQEAYGLMFDKLKEVELSQPVLENVLETHRKRAAAFEIAGIGFDISEGKRDFLELPEAFKRYSTDFLPIDAPTEFVTDSLQDLMGLTYNKPGVKWRLKTLRKMMGSLRKGDMGFVFARPEVGKTTFLADQGGYFATQLDGPLIHFNNEEYGPKVKIRYYQATLGLTTKELFEDIDKHEKTFMEQTKGNIKIYDAATISRREVEAICKKLSPQLLIFDSIDKLKGFDGDRDDLVYKQIYAWSRELAKEYGPVIGVCHASVGAEGKRWLEMDDVAYAKTAKQGEADWILGIGQTHEPGQEHIRHFHLPKNKQMGDLDMDETLRHAKLDVRIYPEVAQYDDLHKFD